MPGLPAHASQRAKRNELAYFSAMPPIPKISWPTIVGVMFYGLSLKLPSGFPPPPPRKGSAVAWISEFSSVWEGLLSFTMP